MRRDMVFWVTLDTKSGSSPDGTGAPFSVVLWRGTCLARVSETEKVFTLTIKRYPFDTAYPGDTMKADGGKTLLAYATIPGLFR